MVRLSVSCLCLSLAATALACEGEPPDSGDAELVPHRDEWRTEYEGDFPYLAGDGTAQITTVTIGSREVGDNFANRGDVIVEFSDTDEIKVEMRRFTFARNDEEAQADFDKLKAWMFNSPDNPSNPGNLQADADCTQGWMDNCGVLVWYDGAIQRRSTGADIRVTLPKEYRHTIRVRTEDNVRHDDDAYPDRGNVCVAELGGSAQVSLEHGNAFVALQRDITPGPTCSASAIERCETWTDDMGNAAWSEHCPCTTFGTLTVQTSGGSAANITADVPAELWSYLSVRNELASGSIMGDDQCTAEIDIEGVTIDDATADNAAESRGELNRPSPAAIMGGGYGVNLSSQRCLQVPYVEGPGDYVRNASDDDLEMEVRGNLVACSGCLAGQSCSDLLDGI